MKNLMHSLLAVINSYTAQDCTKGINLQLGDGHAAVKILQINVNKL